MANIHVCIGALDWRSLDLVHLRDSGVKIVIFIIWLSSECIFLFSLFYPDISDLRLVSFLLFSLTLRRICYHKFHAISARMCFIFSCFLLLLLLLHLPYHSLRDLFLQSLLYIFVITDIEC